MSIHLIIDGYNLIRQSLRLSQVEANDLEAGREALLQSLADYHRRRPQHKITVVFDGWQGGALQESRDQFQGLGVIYSRRGERADEVIKRLLVREGARAVLVSSDRELQNFAERRGAVWLAAQHFESRYLINSEAGQSHLEEEEADPRGPAKKGPARRLKKNLRQKRQRLSKL
ncbi:MAG: NYN domain-containing protein [Desulfobaccales bacterium]